jgi:hypothetical protein
VLGHDEWFGEPHTGWLGVEYRGRVVALYLGEAWRVLGDGLQIIAVGPKDGATDQVRDLREDRVAKGRGARASQPGG